MGPILSTLSLALEGGPSMFKNNVLMCKGVCGHLVGITRSVESLELWPLAWYGRVSLENSCGVHFLKLLLLAASEYKLASPWCSCDDN